MSNTCSIKLLKNAYIGAGVRMSSGKGTVPFVNKPMKGLKIENYSKQGFRISHKDLPKTIWVDFPQLPLTRLKIDRGVIEDEITFVENIVMHQMQLIRTLDTEYIDLLYAEKALAEKESGGDIITIGKAIPGNVYIGAQCKENIPMIYLGTWYTKEIHRRREWRSYNYRNEPCKPDRMYLDKKSPQRAFFLVDTKDFSQKESDLYEAEQYVHPKKEDHEDFDIYRKRHTKYNDEYNNRKSVLKKQIFADGPDERWKIVSYPVSSKRIKKVIITPGFEDRFSDKTYNKELIYNSRKKDGDYYGNAGDVRPDLADFKDEYPRVEMDGFVIATAGYNYDVPAFLTDTKNDIDKRAYKFINENFICTLEPNEVANGHDYIKTELK